MNIIPTFTFWGRCLFNGFDAKNDTNPTTGKAGVNCYRFRFIAYIFEKLGKTLRIHCQNNLSPFNLCVNEKSFKKWVKRHEDKLDAPFDMTKKITSAIAAQCIEKICKNMTSVTPIVNGRTINRGKALKPEEVLAKAEKDFSLHSDKDYILQLIKSNLGNWYKEKIALGEHPYFHSCADGYYEFVHHRTMSDQERKSRSTAFEFLDSLPGVDVTPYKMHWIKSTRIIEKNLQAS